MQPFIFIVILLMWIGVSKVIFKHEFTVKEIAIQAVATSVIIIGIFTVGYHSQIADKKVVNGYVTETEAKRESCPWGWNDYRDNFCTEYRTRLIPDGETCIGTGADRSCITNYKTQYKYIYDWEQRYFVHNDIGSPIEITRVDDQGSIIPERFSIVKIGDPVALTIAFNNYIKGAASTLFNQKFENVPAIAYPQIRDYYRTNRVIYTEYPPNSELWELWNEDFAYLNSNLKEKGVNVILVLTGKDPIWAEKLAQAWDAHKINDIVITIGLENDNVKWVDSRSWSSDHMVNVAIQDGILNLKTLDKDAINGIIRNAVDQYYIPQPIENFEYLAEDISTPLWVWILAAIVMLIVTPAITYYFSNN